MPHYIDIHTHQQHRDDDILSICNLHHDFERVAQLTACSIGVHPWHIHDDGQDQIKTLSAWGKHEAVLAIGECGLDKICKTDFDTQKTVFMQHIQLANAVQKPLIIHCVRAYDEVIALLRHAHVPVIFHGFQKSPELAQTLLHHGFYLSFGAALTENKKNAIESVARIPADRLFLETDDGSTNIRTIYQHAADLRNITSHILGDQIRHNFKTVFTP